MKEELISFDTAKLAVEKGCYMYSTRQYDNDGILRGTMPVNGNYPAPTQSLLQKWLRESHLLNIIIFNDDGSIEDESFRYNYEIRFITFSFKDKQKKSIVGNYSFQTYEETLEAGLQESLKLINT